MRRPNAKHWSRRSLLQTLALGAGGLTMAPLLGRELRAQGLPVDLAVPKRVLFVFSPNGIPERQGWPSWLGQGSEGTTMLFTPITSPLERHRDNVVFFDNLIIASVVEYGDKHHTASRMVLTGSRLLNVEDYGNERPSGPSIDQYLAEKVGRIATPQWPSLELAVQEEGTYVSWSAAGTRTPAIRSPWEAYEKLFANLQAGGEPMPDPSLVKRLELRRSVLDSVAGDIQAFRSRLPAEDRARADAQLDAIRTLETRLTAPVVADACTKPQLGPSFEPLDTKRFPEIMRMNSDLIVSAFACDLTRVALCNIRGGGQQYACDFDPVNRPEEEHALSHDFQDDFAVFKALLNEEIAYIADRLEAIPEGGGTMLDNTLIVQITEISTGHQHGRMPWYTLGGKNMGVKVGQVLKLSTEVSPDANNYRGYPHQKLFVSLLHAMGLEAEDTFGVPDFGTGPMAGFLA